MQFARLKEKPASLQAKLLYRRGCCAQQRSFLACFNCQVSRVKWVVVGTCFRTIVSIVSTIKLQACQEVFDASLSVLHQVML